MKEMITIEKELLTSLIEEGLSKVLERGEQLGRASFGGDISFNRPGAIKGYSDWLMKQISENSVR